MGELRPCPACGGEEHRRSRRRGIWEQLLGRVGILPYVCKTCRKRFLASKGGAAAWIIGLVFLLVLMAAGVCWFYGDDNPPLSQPNLHNTPVKAQTGARELKLREEIDALAGSLVEVRREKAALLAELSLLHDQLQRRIHAVATKAAQPGPQPAPQTSRQSTRSLLGRVSFSSGSAELDAKGRQTLEAIAARLAQTPGARVLVEGAADSTPMGARTAARYGDNAGLAFARALSVFRALRRSGVEQGRMDMSASGRADSGEDAGRTVEVWLVPAS